MEKEEVDAEKLTEKRKGYKRRQVSGIGWGVGIYNLGKSEKELRVPFIEFYDDERGESLALPLETWGSIVEIARLTWLLAGEFVRAKTENDRSRTDRKREGDEDGRTGN